MFFYLTVDLLRWSVKTWKNTQKRPISLTDLTVFNVYIAVFHAFGNTEWEALKQRALVWTYSRSRGHDVPVLSSLTNLGRLSYLRKAERFSPTKTLSADLAVARWHLLGFNAPGSNSLLSMSAMGCFIQLRCQIVGAYLTEERINSQYYTTATSSGFSWSSSYCNLLTSGTSCRLKHSDSSTEPASLLCLKEQETYAADYRTSSPCSDPWQRAHK